jgi:hypothetical protein
MAFLPWDTEDEAGGKPVSALGGGPTREDEKECLEGESNSHLRITQAELGHIL